MWRLISLRVLLLVVAVAQLGDVISTERALSTGGDLREANPLIRLQMETFGSHWWLPKLIIAALFVVMAVRAKRASIRTTLLAAFVAGLYLVVVIKNFSY
jgi:fucose 4-O-acetylase-like acetyltransferase